MNNNGRTTAFVTGATGLVGSHLVERLVADGLHVRCLVRASSKIEMLEQLGVELVLGDVTDEPAKLRELIGGAALVFHCAAMVDDWASREAMVRVNVEGVRNLLEACRNLPTLRRFVMVGSMVVLGMGPQINFDETAPMVHTGDNYNYTKILAFEMAMKYAREHGVPVVICRPPYIYGPRDHQFFPRVFEALKSGRFKFIGDGNQPLTLVFVRNLVEALVLAAAKDGTEGQVFMITDGESVTRRELVEMACEEMGYRKPTTCVPVPVAKMLLPLVEWLGKVRKKRPILNRFQMKFMTTPMTFNIAKARTVLGYAPVEPPRESLRKTIRWYRDHHSEMLPGE
ncbi:MAG: NAD-dependent epimerase/dehydratase family protein [Planctomycetes bacterium]|nr:NAD-dependent epimerase/dehydratase family protein [Planctomycetota bacterium]